MTRFEKDYQAAKDGDGIEVLTRRKKTRSIKKRASLLQEQLQSRVS